MTIRDGDIISQTPNPPSDTTQTPTTAGPIISTTPSTPTCDKNSTESDILEVLDYPVPRFSDGEWISGMGA